MRHNLDWSSYETAGQGDAYAGIPATGGDFARAVAVCINDRQCQRQPKGVMCPGFRVTDDPAQSPGGRVAVLKAALNGELGSVPFAGTELAAAMDLCVGCKGCKRECANKVDMAAIKIEVLAQRNAVQGVPRRDRFFSGLPRWLRRRNLVRGLARLHNSSAIVGRIGERWLGIFAWRRLPVPALRAYTPPGMENAGPSDRDVVLFVDTFARQFEPEIAEAAHAVLTAAGYRVRVLAPDPGDGDPQGDLCCGRAYLSLGQMEEARREARRLQAALAPALAAGTPIVGLEPSCILSLRDDRLKLDLGPQAETLAKQVYLFEEFIARVQDLLPALRAAPRDAPVLANGFSCRHQIFEGSGRRAVHAAVLLREALV